jgi:molecular chaperone DnaK (HSP70)
MQNVPVYHIAGDEEISPEAASAEILKEIMRLADNTLTKHGVNKRKVMVTVPAYFDSRQLDAMHQVLKLAGLETYPEGFAREPTTALASWYEESRTPEDHSWFVVFDLGGGTLDISIVYQKQKYSLVVAGQSGNMFLGGEDFDDVMRELVSLTGLMRCFSVWIPAHSQSSTIFPQCFANLLEC